MVKKFEFNNKDREILNSFAIFPWLPAYQVCSLHYSEKSIQYVKERLAWLASEKEHYLKRKIYPKTFYPYFYRLALRGSRTIEETPPFYPAEKVKFIYLDHFLLTNEVLISSLKLPRVFADTTLSNIFHDYTLKHMLKVVVPDGLVFLRIKNEQVPIWFEITLTLREEKFKEKIAGILKSVRGEYRGVFGTEYVTVSFLTPKAEQVPIMMKWTQEALVSLGELREADLVRFAHIPEKNIDPLELFTKPMHLWLFSKGAVTSLI